MNKKWRLLLLVGLLASCKQNTIEAPEAGLYSNGIELAYEAKTHLLSGIGEINNCSFYFTGKFAGKKTNLIAWLPTDPKNDVFGVLEFIEENHWKINFDLEQFPSCKGISMIEGMSLQEAHPDWIRISSIGRPAEIFREANESTKSEKTLAVFSIVRIIEIQNQWYKIQGDSTNHWVKKNTVREFPG